MPLDDFLFEHQYRTRMEEQQRRAAAQRLAAEFAGPSAFRRLVERRRVARAARRSTAAAGPWSGRRPASVRTR